MVIINGKVYDGVVIMLNGRVSTGDSVNDDSAVKNFDEIKKETANGVKRITIDSNVNVKVSTSNTNEVTAHLHGSIISDQNLNFSVEKQGNEILVSVKSKGTSISSSYMAVASGCSVVINNCSVGGKGGLTLDIQIPDKTFEKLSIEVEHGNIDINSYVRASAITVDSKHGNINIGSDVNADIINVDNAHGSIDLSSTFQTLEINCRHGSIDVDSEACSDVRLDITCQYGNADVTLGNIGNSKVSVNTKHGNCKNNPKLKGIYTASGYIEVRHGNAKFR